MSLPAVPLLNDLLFPIVATCHRSLSECECDAFQPCVQPVETRPRLDKQCSFTFSDGGRVAEIAADHFIQTRRIVTGHTVHSRFGTKVEMPTLKPPHRRCPSPHPQLKPPRFLENPRAREITLFTTVSPTLGELFLIAFTQADGPEEEI